MNFIPPWDRQPEDGKPPPLPRAGWFPPWAGLLDWTRVLTDTEEKDIEWLAWPFVEAGTISSVYCDPKDGKSLVLQLVCKQIALGEPVLGTTAAAPAPVLYLDYENPDSIVGERFLDMGASAAELGRFLIYSSFPAIRPLDTPEGGAMLSELIGAIWNAYGRLPALTVIDTLSKTFTGAESSADTFNDIYRYSLLPLRRARMSVLYLDHSGKDPTAGQRGSSAKPSDVDVVWRLHSQKGPRDLIETVRLEPTHSRTGHVEEFTARIAQEPLRIAISQLPVSTRALELAAVLDSLGVPPDASRATCREALKQHKIAANTASLAEAVKFRKAGGQGPAGSSQDPGNAGDNAGDSRFRTELGTVLGQQGQTASDLWGQSGDSENPGEGTMVPFLRKGQWPAPVVYELEMDLSQWAKWYRAANHKAAAKSMACW